jgi:hypothetical protein
MMLDQRYRTSNAQAITTLSVASTDVVDIASVLRDIGAGEQLVMDFNVVEAFVGNGGLIINNVLDITPALTAAPTFVGSSVLLNAADLFLGAHIYVPITILGSAQALYAQTGVNAGFPLKYFGTFYNLTGGTFSAGKITSGLAMDPVSRVRMENLKDALN